MSEIPMYPDENDKPVCDVCGEAEGERIASQVEVCRLCYMAAQYAVETMKDRVADLESAIRAYVESDDEDRVREWDTMVALLPRTTESNSATVNERTHEK